MPKPPRLSRSAVRILDGKVDDIFDRLMVRLLGHAFTGKRLYVVGGTHEDFSLPGIFREAVTGEGGRPDFDILSGVAEIARDYLEKHRGESKARMKHEVNSLLQDLHSGKISREEFGNYAESALFKLWDSVRSNVERVVETSNENAKTAGIRDGLIQINDKLGVEDPVVCFIPVHDDDLCDECRTIHTVDGYTPRVWLSSEVETGYHRKGSGKPSWNLIHPHCRCALTTILPGFGFNAQGLVTWIGEGHSELEYQRSYKRPPKGEEARLKRIGKSEGAQEALLEVLQKASKPVLEPLEKGLKQSQIQAALRAFGWQDKHGGGHDMMEHPSIGAKIPFQRGYSGDYDWNWVDKHLREAGLMRGRQNKVVADPKHAYYQHYVQSGHAQPTEPQKKTWEAPGATMHVPLESVELGGTPGGREHAEAVQALKAGRPQPAVEVMDLGNGTYGSLGNHHLVQAARDAGMTHIPVKVAS